MGMRLAVMHNLYFYNHLMERIREALDNGTFQQFHDTYVHKLDTRISIFPAKCLHNAHLSDIIEEIVILRSILAMIQFLNAATGTATTAEMLMSFLPMILIIVFMIVLIYLPQKRQDKKDAAMRSSIEIGDKVTTIGGIVASSRHCGQASRPTR